MPKSTIEFTASQLRQIESTAWEAGDYRGAILAARVYGDPVKVIAVRRGKTVGTSAAEREIRSLLSPDECRSRKACLVALKAAFPS